MINNSNSHKRKIAILCRSLSGGGAEKTAANLSIFLKDHYEVHIICLNTRNSTYEYSGLLHDLKTNPTGNIILKIIHFISRLIKLSMIVKKERFDCVISFTSTPNLLNSLIPYTWTRKIVSIRNDISIERVSKLRKAKIIFFCKQSDYIVCLSRKVRDSVINEYGIDPGKVTTIYNACEKNNLSIRSLENKKEFEKYRPYILNVGRLADQKGQKYLIKAFNMIKDKIPNYTLLIMGQGDLDEELRKMIRELKLENSVVLYGFCENPYGAMANCEIYVCSSLYEGLGNTLIEMLAFNKPIISTDCKYGPREILCPETDLKTTERGIQRIEYGKYGVLIPSINESSDESVIVMGNAIAELLKSKEKMNYYKRCSLENANRFGEDEIVRQWIKSIEG